MRESAETETIPFAVNHHDREHAFLAHGGWRVMELIRDWGVEVAAECGSAGLCAPEGP